MKMVKNMRPQKVNFKVDHTVNQSGRNPITDGRAAKKMHDKARATFCLTCNDINRPKNVTFFFVRHENVT